MPTDDDDAYRRALAAYFRGGANVQPNAHQSGVKLADGKKYAVLASGGELLAVYRIRNDGMLKKLKRWPADLER